MKGIRSITAVLFIPLLAVNACLSASTSLDRTDRVDDTAGGAAGSQDQHLASGRCKITLNSEGKIQVGIRLPEDAGAYMEVFGRTNLLAGQWKVLDSWAPTYGSSQLFWEDPLRTNVNAFFYMIHDATLDADGDGYSDRRELYISQTDPASFNFADDDGDGMHDFWEIKLFGNVWTQNGYDDSDGDGLLNNQELFWLAANTIQMVSDPSLYDTDGEGLDDFTELQLRTDPLSIDTDSDGLTDASEVLGSPPTDPNNSDTLAPIVVLAGG